MTTEEQFLTMIYMVFGGFYLGIAMETYRRFLKGWRFPKGIVYLFEIIFWLLQLAILFYLLYIANRGEIRIYVFLAILLGFSTYQALFSSIYKRLLEYFIIFIKKVWTIFKRSVEIFLWIPLRWIFHLLYRMLAWLFFITKRIIQVALYPFRFVGSFLYSLLPKKIRKLFNKIPHAYSIIKHTFKGWFKKR